MNAWRSARGSATAWRSARGSATVGVLALLPLLLAATTAIGLLTEAVALRHRVQAVADLAALAGAQADGSRCRAAAAWVQAQGLAPTGCTVSGGVVAVTVHAAGRGWLATLGGASARGQATLGQ